MTKEERELVTAAQNLMYLGAKNVMRLPGDLEAKTVHFGLPEAIVEEAVRGFARDTKRVVLLGCFEFLEKELKTEEAWAAFDSKRLVISELHKPYAIERLKAANIYVLSPYTSWGVFSSTFGRLIGKIGHELEEFAVVRPYRTYSPRKKQPPKTPDEVNDVLGEFWWTPPKD